ELKKGQRLSVEIEAMRLVNTFFDPYIAILDSKRFELAASDDSPLNKQDGLCSIVAPADGTYIVQVRESAFGGNGACQYRLHVGSPLDSVMVIYNAAGAGLISNDDAIGPDSYFRWTVPADGDYFLSITDHLKKGGPTYAYRVEFQPVIATTTVTIPKVALYS